MFNDNKKIFFENKVNSVRLLALDVLRGITIAGMILVNNPGGATYTPLRHAAWNGLTPTDLVFPFFMFIMGISSYISLRKYDFIYSHAVMKKIVRRVVVIFVLGLAIDWFSRLCRYWSTAPEDMNFVQNLWNSIWTFDRIRIFGVLQRLALSYGIASIVVLFLKHKYLLHFAGMLLLGYFVVLYAGNGFAYDETNVLSVVDRTILTPLHMYNDHGIEPEGLLSTLPSIAHVLIGFWVGRMMLDRQKSGGKVHEELLHSHLISLFLVGTVLTFTGLLLDYGCPINKKIWSPTFVLITCGLASSFLALLIWIIDLKGYRNWSRFFESFGVNPLFIYVLAAVLSTLFRYIHIPWADDVISIHDLFYNQLLQPLLGDKAGSLAYSLLFVLLNWIIGNYLYKKRIYIKI